jgi:thioesterase domain-containing protein
MARRLRDEGEEIPLLCLVDAVFFLEAQEPDAGAAELRSANWVERVVSTIQRQGTEGVLQKVRRRFQYGYQDTRQTLAKSERRLRIRLGMEMPAVLEHNLLFLSYTDALRNYQCPEYDGCVSLYAAQEWGVEPRSSLSPGSVTIRAISGGHETIFENDQLIELAAAVQRDLAKVDGRR